MLASNEHIFITYPVGNTVFCTGRWCKEPQVYSRPHTQWTQLHTFDPRVSSCWFRIIWAHLGWSLRLQSWRYYRFLHSSGRFGNTAMARWPWKRRNRTWDALICHSRCSDFEPWGAHSVGHVFSCGSPSFKNILTYDNLYEKRIWKRMNICICITESLCWTPETNTML